MFINSWVPVTVKQIANAPLKSLKRQFEKPFKTMKTNLLTPEIEFRPHFNSTPEVNYSGQPLALKEQRSDSPAGEVLRGLDHLSRTGQHLYKTRILTGSRRTSSQISRYVFEGDLSRESPIRIGIFAGLSGNDKVGPRAVSTFLGDLVALPHLGNNLRIYAYPVVSSASFETGAPSPRPRQYIINQMGYQGSSSETYQIEREIFAIAFDGIISIHLEEEIKNFKISLSEARWHETMLSPILSSLQWFLPNVEDGGYDSRRSLTAGIRLKQRPFELILRVPSSGWSGLHAIGLRIALHTAVDCYRSYLMQHKRNPDLRFISALQPV